MSVDEGLAERLAQLAALIAELAETVSSVLTPEPAVEVPVLLDIDEAARLLNVSRAKLYEGPIERGELLTVFIGSRRLDRAPRWTPTSLIWWSGRRDRATQCRRPEHDLPAG